MRPADLPGYLRDRLLGMLPHRAPTGLVRIGAPGRSSPVARARSTMCIAGRSFIPPGLNPSSLAQKPRPSVANGPAIRNTGVWPTIAPDRSLRPRRLCAQVLSRGERTDKT